MNKPDSLRDLLLQAVPGLRKNPERPLMFIDQGKVRCTAAASLSFEYSYTLQMILTDFAGHPDSVMIPILDWLRVNQSELLVNMDKSAEGLKFEADMLDRSKVDLSLTLPLTERVIVTRRGGGGFDVAHAAEPQYEGYAELGSVTLFADGEPIATWHRRR
ncbi:phage tail protein [Pseudomonas plecoglossicida]|uniref:phage tail protein n=1 Tax=Pseudomonas plecoglossicida TaxID=70775 RepID=UPI0015E3D75F|nr:phage tail protein [Pseudomonas plecoglossicida]MBA1324141.1 phage tail protein [Pseudomonas plecoglossicida]